MKPIRVHVNITNEDIRTGEIAHAGKCPLAYASARALAENEEIPACEVRVIESLYFYYDLETKSKWIKVAELPQQVKEWVSRFDSKKQVEPIAFDIDVYLPTQNELDSKTEFIYDRKLN
jgi:hypothetical protein